MVRQLIEWFNYDLGNLSLQACVNRQRTTVCMDCYGDRMLRSATNLKKTVGISGLEIFMGPSESTISTLPQP